MDKKPTVTEWSSNNYRRPYQGRHHANQVRDYLSWAHLTAEEAIDLGWKEQRDRGTERRILNYYKHLNDEREAGVEGAKTEVAAFDCINAIRSFYKYYGLEIKFRRNEIEEPAPVYTDHRFTLSEIAGMVHAAPGLRNKSIILFGSSTGLREGDIAKCPRRRIEDLLNGEAPVCIGPINTEKKRVPAHPFLHKTAIKYLKEYLAERTDDLDLLFPTDEGNPCDGHYLNGMVKTAFEKAGLKAPEGERVRFHCLRKFVISRMQDAGLETNVWKTIIGKKTKEAPYTTEQLRQHFVKVQDRLDPEAITDNHAKLEDVTGQLDKLERENARLNAKIAELALDGIGAVKQEVREAVRKMHRTDAASGVEVLNGRKEVAGPTIRIENGEVAVLKAFAQILMAEDEDRRAIVRETLGKEATESIIAQVAHPDIEQDLDDAAEDLERIRTKKKRKE
jgi:integrase